MEGQRYFSKIGTASEKEDIFRTLGLVNPVLFVFNKELECLKFAIETISGYELTGRLKEGAPQFESATVTVNFSLKENQYFLKARCEIMAPKSDKRYHFDFSGDLYKLQRRSNFRVKIPAKNNYRVEFSELNGEAVQQTYRLFDLSAGGMGVLVPKDRTLNLETGQTFVGKLMAGSSREIAVKGCFRYQRSAKGLPGVDKIAGFQFLDLRPKEEQFVLSLVMDVYRELFSPR